MTDPIRVLIVDDQALLRGSFRLLIDTAANMTVVGEAADGAQAVGLAREQRPDVVLMDIRMPELDGIAATRLICEAPDTDGVKVLILTTFDLDSYVYDALRAGASGFLLKDTPPLELLSAINVIAEGQGLLSPTITRRLIAEFVHRPVPARQPIKELAGITAREREVLTLIAGGMSNTEICRQLHLSPATVKTHIGRLLAKLHARDRAQLVIVGYETGLVTVKPRH